MKKSFVNTLCLALGCLLYPVALSAQVYYAGKAPAKAVARPAANTLENNVLGIHLEIAKDHLQQVVFPIRGQPPT